MPLRRTTRAPLLAGGLAALALWTWRNGAQVWPYLFRSAGDFGYQYPAAAALLAGASPYGSPWYDYPPLPALALAPLALLPLDAARIAWFLIAQVCLLAAALLLVRPLGGGAAAAGTVAGVWLLAGTVQENLALGQWNPVLLLLLVLALRWDGARPGHSAAALGLAAAVKVWPGLLLAGALARRRGRALILGLGTAAAGVLVPVLVFTACASPPYLPSHGSYWMGSPHPLNLSLPAAVLRATYSAEEGSAESAGLPRDWDLGNNPGELHLSPGRRALSVGVALAVLAAGLAALALRLRNLPPAGTDRSGPLLLAALVALALLAAPLAWYHYQLLQLPGLALLAAPRLRRLRAGGWRAAFPLLGLAALLTGLTHAHLYGPLGRLLGADELTALQVAGWAVPLLGALLFVLLLRARAPHPRPLSHLPPCRPGEGRHHPLFLFPPLPGEGREMGEGVGG